MVFFGSVVDTECVTFLSAKHVFPKVNVMLPSSVFFFGIVINLNAVSKATRRVDSPKISRQQNVSYGQHIVYLAHI